MGLDPDIDIQVSPFATKFTSYELEHTQVNEEEMLTVPCLYGHIEGSDVVWHGRPTQTGSYFSELYKGEETKDTKVQVVVQFLTTEQLAALHTTEGETYNITVLKNIDLGNGVEIDGVAYAAGESSILLDDQGRPISVKGVQRRDAQTDVKSAREALEYTLSNTAVKDAIGEYTPDSYALEGTGLPLSEKRRRQERVEQALEQSQKSRPMTHEASFDNNYGRANFISLPKGLHGTHAGPHQLELMEQSLARLRQPREITEERLRQRKIERPHESEGVARRKLDIVERLRYQAHRDLMDERRAEALAHRTSSVKRPIERP